MPKVTEVKSLCPDALWTDPSGVKWLTFRYSVDDQTYFMGDKYPTIIDYDGLTWHYMSWDSDRRIVRYKESRGKSWHQRNEV